MTVDRWALGPLVKDPAGGYVLHPDHVEAVTAAYVDAYLDVITMLEQHRQGYRPDSEGYAALTDALTALRTDMSKT